VFFAIGNLLWFIIAILAGTLAGALAVIAAKQFVRAGAETPEGEPQLAAV
jgi:PTS system fructose-specific IIC component